jgi:hypothetical protein
VKALLLSACFVAFTAICFAQSDQSRKPDLSGTWKLDAGKNTDLQEEIKITHHDPRFIVRRKAQLNDAPAERELTYYTDGRGETNLRESQADGFESWRPAETESKTTWNKNSLVTRSVSLSVSSGAVSQLEIVDEWRLSGDGKTLTLTTRTLPKKDSPGNAAAGAATEFKRVYKLISK